MNTPIDKLAVARSFTRAADHYDEHDFVQRETGARLLERFKLFSLEPSALIDLGSGTGRFTRTIKKRYPKAQSIQLDIALGMLLNARRSDRRWFPKYRFVCADFEALPFADASVDLVFSNLAFQWCADLTATFKEVRRVLRKDGLIVFSTLGPQTLHELRDAWLRGTGSEPIMRFVDMHDVGDALVHAGFANPVIESETLDVRYATVKDLLRDLKGIGANAAPVNAGLGGKGRFREFMTAYETYRQAGRLPATYELIFAHAWAGRTPAAQPQEATFPISALGRR
ncbi:MAG: malonyl-ACP O-methyltransferase BioC [Pseudomonadota bacterium]